LSVKNQRKEKRLPPPKTWSERAEGEIKAEKYKKKKKKGSGGRPVSCGKDLRSDPAEGHQWIKGASLIQHNFAQR